MKSFVYFILLQLIISLNSFCQDYHFSQFYANPLGLNPATTGNIAEDFRFSTIYRTQWRGISSAFETAGMGFDMNFKDSKLRKDKIGAGIYFYKDAMGENIINSNSIALSLAYHHPLDIYQRHVVSVGVQGGYIQKTLNLAKLTFADQYEDFILSRSTSEPFAENQVGYPTVNAGLFYSFKLNQRTDVSAGLSVFQINTPKESFYGSLNKLNARWSGYLALNYKLKQGVTFSPRMLYLNHENGMDINPGAYVGKTIGKRSLTLYAGGWYRVNDALVGMIGSSWKSYTLRFSYDATVSGLRQVKRSDNLGNRPKTGAFEVSLIILGKLSRPYPDAYTIPCGIF